MQILVWVFFPCIFFLVTYILCDMICGYSYLENIGLYLYT